MLASRSPRRARLLREAGYELDVVPADIDESRFDAEPPRRYVSRLAAAKAAAIASRAAGRIVVAADTGARTRCSPAWLSRATGGAWKPSRRRA